ncbi:unnamed protein product [Auanema sp. JU1783]|nr:unnamed protein product [Auanema sp. JU1783]
MKIVIQRVTQSSVSVAGSLVSSIGKGLCVLVGIHTDDTDDDIQYTVRKILNTRIFDGETKRWDKSVKDLNLEVLCVSQFTLYGILKGNKLDFHNSMGPKEACEFYGKFISQLRSQYNTDLVKDGVFAAMMEVQISNDGPVTVVIDSKDK